MSFHVDMAQTVLVLLTINSHLILTIDLDPDIGLDHAH
jgi:hypothetical protein